MKDMITKIWRSFTGKLDDESKKGSVDTVDVAKIIRNSLLVGLAAALTYGIESVSAVNLGSYGPVIVVGLTFVLDTIKKFYKNNEVK